MADMMETNEKPQTEYFLNESTGRYIKVGSSTHKRLIKKLNCVKPIAQRVSPTEPMGPTGPKDLSKELSTGNIKVQDVNSNDVLRHRLMEESTDMVKENLDSLGDVGNMSQKELDKMLKKLLIEKLGLGKSKTSKTKKKKKKSKFKIKTPPPTESDTESDTEPDSD
jgi:hypothetical protein